MSISTINFKYNDIPEAVSLGGLVEQKVQSLKKFISEDESVTCDAEFEKVAQQQTGSIYHFEINLLVNGTLFFAEATEDSFEKAIDEVRDELDKELRRAKDKQVTLSKQAGREAKEQMLNGE